MMGHVKQDNYRHNVTHGHAINELMLVVPLDSHYLFHSGMITFVCNEIKSEAKHEIHASRLGDCYLSIFYHNIQMETDYGSFAAHCHLRWQKYVSVHLQTFLP